MSEVNSELHEVHVLSVEALSDSHRKGLSSTSGRYIATLAMVPPPEQAALQSDMNTIRSKQTTTGNEVLISPLGVREVEIPGGGGRIRQAAVIEVQDGEPGIGTLVDPNDPDHNRKLEVTRERWVLENIGRRQTSAANFAALFRDAANRFRDPEGAGARYRKFVGRILLTDPEEAS